MAKCYICGKYIKVPKHTLPNGKYICRKCYFKLLLKKKLRIFGRVEK